MTSAYALVYVLGCASGVALVTLGERFMAWKLERARQAGCRQAPTGDLTTDYLRSTPFCECASCSKAREAYRARAYREAGVT